MTTVRTPMSRPAPPAQRPASQAARNVAIEVEPGAQVLGELVQDVIGSIVDLFTDRETVAPSAQDPLPRPGHSGPRVEGIDTKLGLPAEALRVQSELADTRRALGTALEQHGEISRRSEGDGVLADANGQRLNSLEAEIDSLRSQLSELGKTEAGQPREDVERARFEVFLDSFEALERSRGPEVAARLARQAWYNGRTFNIAGGSAAATEAELLKTGFPASPLMQSPGGERIDMGHVACALDWQLNPNPTHDLLVDLEQVTLTGDLAAAAQHLAANAGTAEASLEAQAGRADLLGDIDGLNLAARIRANAGSEVGMLLRDYYATGSDADRMDEFASHSSLFKREADGSPIQDASGRWVLDAPRLAERVRTFATRLALLEYGAEGASLDRISASVDEVLEAWAQQELLALG